MSGRFKKTMIKRKWQQETDQDLSLPDSVDCSECGIESSMFCYDCKRYFCAADFTVAHPVELSSSCSSSKEALLSKSRHKFRLTTGIANHTINGILVGRWEHSDDTQYQQFLKQSESIPVKPSSRTVSTHLADGLLMTCFPLIAESLCDLFVLARVCKQWAKCSTSPIVLGQSCLGTQRLSDRQCSFLKKLVGLRTLKVKGATLTHGLTDCISDTGVVALASLTTLQDLRLTCKWGTDWGCQALSALSQLRRLDLCWWRNLRSVACLAVLPLLTSFKLKLSSVSESLIPSIAELTCLQKLSLHLLFLNTHVYLGDLSKLVNLRTLQLKGGAANKGSIEELSVLSHLSVLDLGGRDVNIAPCLQAAMKFPNVQVLNLSAHPILTHGAWAAITSMSSLQWLSLVRCQIPSAMLHTFASSLTRLRFLDLTGSCGYDIADVLSFVKRRPDVVVVHGKQDIKRLNNGLEGDLHPDWSDPGSGQVYYDFYNNNT